MGLGSYGVLRVLYMSMCANVNVPFFLCKKWALKARVQFYCFDLWLCPYLSTDSTLN